MEDLFALLARPSRLPDGSRALPHAPQPSSGANGAAQHAEQQQALEERRHSNGAASSSNGAASSSDGSTQHHPAGGLRLELRDVKFGYGSAGGRQVLRGISLTAEPGESIAVVGEWPCGWVGWSANE